MKIFNRFKQLKKDIKLVIITVLIMSCIGVYATGECIIAATADDVTYNNTTVQAAIDELYSMTQSYCPPGYECEKRTLYKIMAKNAVLDNIASTYVTSSTGIDFSQISSDTNGKGIYEIASTKDDDYPIYYYRGAVDNNNVKFANFCWKAIRTTDTGGVKLIYNGSPNQDGYCLNTNIASIVRTTYNTTSSSPAYVGYMYGTVYSYSYKRAADLGSPYVYGNDVTYSNGIYTLTNTITSTGTWSNDYNTLNNNHYTCFSTGTTCTSVYYIYYTTESNAYYRTLSDGKKINDALDEMLSNTTDSNAKSSIDSWYNRYLSSYTSYIEDTIYCNDRSISQLGGWSPNGNTRSYLYFSPQTRLGTATPSLVCSRALDRFTVSSSKGNGDLTYPVGLITSDEVRYAGGKSSTTNNTYYLYTNSDYFTISSTIYNIYDVSIMYVDSSGALVSNYVGVTARGLRPVISLSPNVGLSSDGDGTSSNPYVISTN